jgi:hypothetical protein
MATIKRMSRTSKPAGKLTEGQRDNLIGGFADLLTKGINEPDPLFKNDEHRKQAYHLNRVSLFNEAIAEGPGFRPRGFWDYEAELEEGESQHEYLIRNNLLYPGELEEIIAAWLKTLKANCGSMKAAYKAHIAGEYDPAGQQTQIRNDVFLWLTDWPEIAAHWTREAELYGGAALKAWQEVLKKLEEELDKVGE